MEIMFKGEGRHGKGTWLDKDSRLRQKLQDKNKFKSSFQCVLSFSLLCSHEGCIPGVVMCLGKAGCLWCINPSAQQCCGVGGCRFGMGKGNGNCSGVAFPA